MCSKEKVMKKLCVLLLSVLFFAGCYKEDIDRLYSEQTKLEAMILELQERCEQINKTVELLQTLINGSMIKETRPFEDAETGASGWEIVFTDNTSFRVYNGKDGETPVISVVQENEEWYWTLNGEKLTDAAGNPLRMNGKDGITPTINADGYWVIDGVVTNIKASGSTPTVEINADGYWVINGEVTAIKASVTEPALKIGADLIDNAVLQDKTGATIVNTAWYLSVDGGQTWVRVSGKDGANTGGSGGNTGGDGCLIESISLSADGMTVIILLSNGQEIRVPSWAWAETLVQQVNDLAITLNTWITNAKYITDVAPLKDAEGKEIGWRISYNDATYSDVYNGKDGVTGPAGATPEIRVVKEGDDYYWTVDGEKLLIDGQPVKASAITPQLQLGEALSVPADVQGQPVVAGVWYLSVDGVTWARVSGEKGDSGDKGDTGDAFFKKAPEIDATNGWVIFTLSDGTEIKVALYDWVKSKFDEINTEFTDVWNLLNQVADRKYITAVTEIRSEDGRYVQQYKIAFSDGTEILLGNTVIGIRSATPADGGDQSDLYWTINGVDLLYNGQPIKANAQDALGAPQIKTGTELINAGISTAIGGENIIPAANYLSVDGGSQWVRLTGDQGIPGDKGEQGDPGQSGLIVEVVRDPDGFYVTFKLGDGSEDIVVPTKLYIDNMAERLTHLSADVLAVKEFLQGGMIIRSVTEKTENGKKVYELLCRTFGGRDRTIIIRDGADGLAGLAPTISVQAGTGDDKNYYWVVNGELLKDASGNPIPVNGQQGEAGVPGQSAPAPQLKLGSMLSVATDMEGNPIDGFAFYLSVDDGVTWAKVSGPEGQPGKPGEDGNTGDSFFENVSLSADGYWLTLTLKNVADPVVVPTQKWMNTIQQTIQDMNDRIDAIDQILNNGIIITSVTPFDEDGKSGYELIYTKNGVRETIKIYNGQNAAIPVISIKQDPADGGYYWTKDGEYIMDEGGNRFPAKGDKGDSGTPGDPGQDGKDAPLPQLKSGQELQNDLHITQDASGNAIDIAAVYLSVDGGIAWVRVSGEKGTPGEDGKPGDPADAGFTAELVKPDEYWIRFTFTDGTVVDVPTKKWVTEIKDKLDALNTNFEALKNVLDKTKYIKSIDVLDPVAEGGKTGWEIKLMDIAGQEISPSYKIYNGVDGQKGDPGAEGPEGSSPVIGMKKDPATPGDETLYWTVNDAFMTTPDGSYVPVSGKDAPTPQVAAGATLPVTVTQDAAGNAIVMSAYYLSVDGGTLWYKVSGEKGDKGDSLIESVDAVSSDEYVLFSMADGTTFKVAKYIEITIAFNVSGTLSVRKNSSENVNFSVSGSYAKNLSLTTIVGGNWKVLQYYDEAVGSGTLTIQAPGAWDHNKVVLLLTDQKGRVWTSSLTVETTWVLGDPFVDTRDERTYTIYRFDNKLWMTEDLKYTKANGYTYNELTNICPQGWRIPTNEDWSNLNDNFDVSAFGSASVGGGWWSGSPVNGDGTASIWLINASSLSSEHANLEIPRSVRCVKDGYNSPY